MSGWCFEQDLLRVDWLSKSYVIPAITLLLYCPTLPPTGVAPAGSFTIEEEEEEDGHAAAAAPSAPPAAAAGGPTEAAAEGRPAAAAVARKEGGKGLAAQAAKSGSSASTAETTSRGAVGTERAVFAPHRSDKGAAAEGDGADV